MIISKKCAICIDIHHSQRVITINAGHTSVMYYSDMIKVLTEGQYQLTETKEQTKILSLDDKQFAWVNVSDIGGILITSFKKHDTDTVLSLGKYRLYGVKDEPDLTDLQHLELCVGDNTWQGYLLTTGLPNGRDKRNRIIPTNELITKSLS